jgi:hypothetical protein
VTADSGSVDRLILPAGELANLYRTPQMASCALDSETGSLWVLLGPRQIKITEPGVVRVFRPPSTNLRRYDLTSGAFEEYDLRNPCNALSAASGTVWAYSIENPVRKPYTSHQLSIREAGLETNLAMPDGHTVIAMCPRAGIVVTAHDVEISPGSCRLSCLEVISG